MLVAAVSSVVSRSLIAVSPEVASLSAHSDGWTPLAILDTPPCKTLAIKTMTFLNDNPTKSLQDIKSSLRVVETFFSSAQQCS